MDMDAEEDGLGILVDVGNNNNAQLPKKERRSFYELPKNLMDEDDTFGVIARSSSISSQPTTTCLLDMGINTGVLVDIDSSQSSTEASTFSEVSANSRCQIFSSSKALSFTSSVASKSSLCQSSLSNSRYFDNISRISKVGEASENSLVSDDVFELADKDVTNEKVVDWNMIMNEAQFLALSIQDKPNNTPVQKIVSDSLMGNFSPCEGLDQLDSPSFDLLQERPPENLLTAGDIPQVERSPDKPPIKNLNNEIKGTVSPKTGGQCNEEGAKKIDINETPKTLRGKSLSSDKPSAKENINPGRPRPLTKSLKTDSKNTASSHSQSEEKNEKQMSPLTTKPGTGRKPSADKNEPVIRGQCIDKSKRRTPAKPLQSQEHNITSTAKRISHPTKSYTNVKSKINSGMTMPMVKGTLGGGTPASKPTIQHKMSSVKKVGSLKPMSDSSAKSALCPASKSAMQVPRPSLARQGSNLARPTSATPSRGGARQSLAFGTPNSKSIACRLSVAVPARRSLVTPVSSLPQNSGKNRGSAGPSTPSRLQSVTSATRMATPKSRGSARYTLPSPQVMTSKPTLVHSTPAIANPRVIPSGLPSPIGVKRRGR